jgi:hypothetical protein
MPTPRPTRPPPIASSPSVALRRFTPSKVEYAALGRVAHDCKMHHHTHLQAGLRVVAQEPQQRDAVVAAAVIGVQGKGSS